MENVIFLQIGLRPKYLLTNLADRAKKVQAIKGLLLDYTDRSTIQGLNYIFNPDQTWIGRIFWTLVVAFMLILGLYWCYQLYDDWRSNPVLTTIRTTGLPVEKVGSGEPSPPGGETSPG